MAALLEPKSIKVFVFDLKESGFLIQFPSTPSLDSVSDPDNIVHCFVIDRSGSMGKFSGLLINEAIPQALLGCGHSPDMKVHIITFDSKVEHHNLTIAKLPTLPAHCRGATYMSGVIPFLTKIIQSVDESIPVVITVISDGLLADEYDKRKTVIMAKDAVASFSTRVGPIHLRVNGIMTSSDPTQAPDVKALSAMACFDTSGQEFSVKILQTDYSDPVHLTAKSTVNYIVGKLIEDLSIKTNSNIITSSLPVMRRMPNSPVVSNIVVPCEKESYFIIETGADLSAITCNGVPIVLEKVPLTSEKDIEPFLGYIFKMAQYGLVRGHNESDLKAIIDWTNRLEKILITVAFEVSFEKISVTLRDRAHFVKSKIVKQRGTLINQILALANMEHVDKLNNAQQLEFLRRNLGTGIAKRAEKLGIDMDFEATVCKEIEKFSSVTLPTVSSHIDSFYSRANWKEILEATMDLVDVSNEIKLDEVVRIVGAIGVACHVKQKDYPDPWDIKVIDVYPSTFFLSQADIIESRHDGRGTKLLFPGTDLPINAVIPLRVLDEKAYDFYMTHLKKINELQYSDAIRGAHAPMPWDTLALDSAVLRRLICQIGPTKPVSEIEKLHIDSLFDQVFRVLSTYGRKSFEKLVGFLSCEDSRPFLTGDNDVSGTLKVITLMIAHPVCEVVREDPSKLGRKMCEFYELEAYCGARKAYHFGGRDEAFIKFFGIDIEESRRRSNVGAPFEPDGIYDGNIPPDLDVMIKNLDSLDWMPPIDDFTAIARFASKSKEPISIHDAFCIGDINIFRLGVAAKAFLCTCEDDLINKTTGTANGPTFGNAKDIFDYIKINVFPRYNDDYAKRLDDKRSKEKEMLFIQLLDELIMTKDIGEFIVKLNKGIPNRSCGEYNRLVAFLLDLDKDVLCRLDKLWIIIVARDKEGEPVWTGGNVFNGDLGPFSYIFNKLDPSGDMWTAIIDIKQKYGIYKYRQDGTNRHGHGNGKPSYVALGYRSIRLFQEGVSPEIFAEYARVHYNCCGFSK